MDERDADRLGEQRETGGLGGDREERRHDDRAALVDVRRPEVEGDGGDLEADPDHDHDQRRQRQRARGEPLGDRHEVGRAGEP